MALVFRDNTKNITLKDLGDDVDRVLKIQQEKKATFSSIPDSNLLSSAKNIAVLSRDQLHKVILATSAKKPPSLDWINIDGISSCIDLVQVGNAIQPFLRAETKDSQPNTDGIRLFPLNVPTLITLMSDEKRFVEGLDKENKKQFKSLIKLIPDEVNGDASKLIVDSSGFPASKVKKLPTAARSDSSGGAKREREGEIEKAISLSKMFVVTDLQQDGQIAVQIRNLKRVRYADGVLIGTKVDAPPGVEVAEDAEEDDDEEE